MIQVFEDVKNLSKNLILRLPIFNCNNRSLQALGLRRRIINQEVMDVEHFLLQKVHQDFTFFLCGVEKVDNKMLGSVK